MPLNWIVFRIIGRVEWAWIAAPLISVVGAVVVAKSVQLDVGFSRSQTTLNVIELHSGYRRGHVSGFASLYTSLSTGYSVYCSEPNGIVFPLTSSNSRSKGTLGEPSLRYTYAGTEGSGLPYFPVRSNSTAILRSESVHELDGAISMDWEDSGSLKLRCANDSSISLRDTVVVARTPDRRWRLAVIGNFDGHAKTTLEMVEQTGSASKPIASIADIENVPWSIWSSGKPGEKSEDSKALYSESAPIIAAALIEVARLHQVEPGETVLIGWSEAAVSGLRIQPKASEEREQTLFVVRSVRNA